MNKERDYLDLSVMRPLTQLGGISFERVRDTFELPRSSFTAEMETNEAAVLKMYLEGKINVLKKGKETPRDDKAFIFLEV